MTQRVFRRVLRRWEAILLVCLVAGIAWMAFDLLRPAPRAVIRLEPYRASPLDPDSGASVAEETANYRDASRLDSLGAASPGGLSESSEFSDRAEPGGRTEGAPGAGISGPVKSVQSGFVAGGASEKEAEHPKKHRWRLRHAKKKGKHPGVIRLNAATAAELEQLPGVGPKMARRILEYRAGHGHFSTIEEIMEVKGIGAKKFAKMKAYLRI